MLGALLALFSSACFAMNVTVLRRGVLKASVLQAIAITVPIGVPFFLIILLVFDCYDILLDITMSSWIYYGLAGITHFVVGRYCNYQATKALGATQAGPVTQLGLLISVFSAFFFLQETVNITLIIGILLILAGPLVILIGTSNKDSVVTKSGIKIKYKEGYLWGLMCAICFGLSPFLIKLGLNVGGLKENIVGCFVSYLNATILVYIVLLIKKEPLLNNYKMNKNSFRLFLVTGFLVFLSQLLKYMALALAPITIVEPIQRTTVIFRILFSWLINRKHEIINLQTILGIFISLIGVYAIILNI